MDYLTAIQLDEYFEESFTKRGELGAAAAVYEGSDPSTPGWSAFGGFLDQRKARSWRPDSPVLIWSATKGLAAACLLHALQEAGMNLETRVAEVWPEFAARGKGGVTLGQMMSHQAGLPGLVGEAGKLHISDHEGVAAGLAAQEPLWEPGTAHGYHARTIGFLLDECLRRITQGVPLSLYWRKVFGEALRLDTWIGLPEEVDAEAAEIIPPRYAASTDPEDPYYRALADAKSLTRLAFATPNGYRASEMNAPEARRVPIASWGGYSTAISLAKFYALLAGDGTWEGKRFFTEATLEWMRTPLVNGPDEILKKPTSFAAGFMLDPIDPATGEKVRQLFGPNPRAFGHPGAGGCLAFADPGPGYDAPLSFSYIMNQMEFGVFPGEKSLGLVERLYENRG